MAQEPRRWIAAGREPGPNHPWRAVYDGLHHRVRKLLRRYRSETGERGDFFVDVVSFANWVVGLRIDRVGDSWRSYAHWAAMAIDALPATPADRARARAILREEPGAATDAEVAERTEHAAGRVECTRLRRNLHRRRQAWRARGQ
jgi:hypothetical protein